MVVRRWLIVILLLVPLALRAQTEAMLEQWVEETGDEAAAGELSDEWLRLRQHPVNLNDTLALERLFFLSPFQRQALRNYILLYGQLLSLKELQFVPGFDSATVALLTEVAEAAPYTPPRRWRWFCMESPRGFPVQPPSPLRPAQSRCACRTRVVFGSCFHFPFVVFSPCSL